jgi:nifR3 family TIM-barrel protein
MGAGLVFTEMISDMGLVYNGTKTRQIADTTGEQQPVAVQIFGSQAEPMAQAARIVEEMGAQIIDINMGCPTPKIVKNGEGAALMLDLDHSREIIRAVVGAVQVPVTVKMRKGWDENNVNCLELAGLAESEGVTAVTLHPRTRSHFFAGKSDWQMIREMKKQLGIPVIGSGDICKAEDAWRMIEETNCDAVMIGRAVMGNPFIIRETIALLEKGTKIISADWEERLALAREHLDLAITYKGERVAVREMRKHVAWYIKGMRAAARLRENINKANTREEMLAILNSLSAGSSMV